MKDKKNVMITLVSKQSEGDETTQTELITEGWLKKTADGFMISYDETEVTGFVGSTTKLTTVGDSCVTMERKGTATSQLIIEKNKKHHCHYGTPYGDFMVGVTTNSIVSALSEKGGKLAFEYVIDINSSYVGNYAIDVDIRAN